MDSADGDVEAAVQAFEADGAAMRARLGARTSRTSVPSIWIGGEYVGGLNDGPGILPLDAEGALEPKLKGAGSEGLAQRQRERRCDEESGFAS